jgi:polar amino acid transport system substrate-binding protein
MWRGPSLVALTVIVVLGAACGGAGHPSSAAPSTTRPVETTTTAVMDGTFMPATRGAFIVESALPAPGWYQGTDPAQLTGGYEYAMAKEIARRLGAPKVVFKNVDYSALVAGDTGTFDLGLAEAMISRRPANVDYTIPYFAVDQGVMVNRGTTVNASNLRDLLWGVQRGTTGQSLVEERIQPTRAPAEFDDLDALFKALKNGAVDAVLMDTIVELPQAKAQHARVVAQFATGDAYGGVLPEGSSNLGPINRTINEMADDGTLARLAAKWLGPTLGADPTKVPYLQLS